MQTLSQGRHIKNYCPVKVVTNSFHPIPLLVFSDSTLEPNIVKYQSDYQILISEIVW